MCSIWWNTNKNMKEVAIITKEHLKEGMPEIQPGDTVNVSQRIKEKGKERLQAFEGIVLARKHGKGINATITVRKVVAGVGVEKIFPLHTPTIEKIEITKRGKVRRAKLYYLREAKGRKARLKRKDIKGNTIWPADAKGSGETKESKKEEPKKPAAA